MNIQEFRSNARTFGWGAACRFVVAHLLDRSRRTCWAELVYWAASGDWRANIWQGRECQKDVHSCGGCYCGKFQGGGR